MKIEKFKLYSLGFSYCLGIGPMKFAGLIRCFGTIEKAYLSNRKGLIPILGHNLSERFIEFRRKFDPVREFERLNKEGITVLAVDDENYPENLKNISDSPICIYIKGDPNIFNARSSNFFTPVGTLLAGNKESQVAKNLRPSLLPITSSLQTYFAIVGTRKPTSYGRQIAYKFARELTEAGFVIVSGMAMGIDTIAHQATLDAGGKTVAVLGCGINIVYPAINRNLYENIIKAGGAVISEFPPNQAVLKGLFISRNRIISGLSKGVLVAEGGEYSGSLITAKYAGIQGKDVFAVPSSISSEMSKAPNLLIKQGAKMVTTVKDIFDEMDIKITPNRKEDIRSSLNEDEKTIFDIMQIGSQTIDDLAIRVNKTVSEVLNMISVLEIKGIIEKNQEHKYQIKI